MKIGEIARRAGLNTSAIRYYEGIGLLPAPPRRSGQREYGEEIVAKLALIQMGQQLGLSIAEIHMLLYDFPEETPPSERWRSLAGKKLIEIDTIIQQAQLTKARLEQTRHCTCASLLNCARV